MKGEDILQLLQDVDWVVGSFVADRDGELLIYLMPPEFGEAELGRTTARLASIVRSAELCGLGVETCDFSLSRYQLVMTRFRAGMLCVMVEAPVSKRALSMATQIALAELPEVVEALTADGSADFDDEATVNRSLGQASFPDVPAPRDGVPAPVPRRILPNILPSLPPKVLPRALPVPRPASRTPERQGLSLMGRSPDAAARKV